MPPEPSASHILPKRQLYKHIINDYSKNHHRKPLPPQAKKMNLVLHCNVYVRPIFAITQSDPGLLILSPVLPDLTI